eukprot:scaffold34063_cov84-Isochrysis_galbana.AAC.1
MSNNIAGFNPNASGTQQNLSAPLRLAIDQAAETGHELVIVGFGAEGWCGLCEKQRDDPAFRRYGSHRPLAPEIDPRRGHRPLAPEIDPRRGHGPLAPVLDPPGEVLFLGGWLPVHSIVNRRDGT